TVTGSRGRGVSSSAQGSPRAVQTTWAQVSTWRGETRTPAPAVPPWDVRIRNCQSGTGDTAGGPDTVMVLLLHGRGSTEEIDRKTYLSGKRFHYEKNSAFAGSAL